jgi:hypothetical protein
MEENPVNVKRGVFPGGIDGITNERVPDVAKMDTNLMSPAGQEVALDQGKSLLETDEDTVTGPGGSPLLDNGHTEPIARVSTDRLVDDSHFFTGETPGEGQVSLFDRT